MAGKTHVCFVCTGNSIRSQMAEGYLRSMEGGQIRVESAGVMPAGIHPLTVLVMREDGVEIGGQWSKAIEEIDLPKADLVVTLCGTAREMCPQLPGRVRQEHWPVEDPISAVGNPSDRLDKFRMVRNEIRERVRDLVSRLREEAGKS